MTGTEYRQDFWHQKTLSLGCHMTFLRDPTFSHFGTLPLKLRLYGGIEICVLLLLLLLLLLLILILDRRTD